MKRRIISLICLVCAINIAYADYNYVALSNSSASPSKFTGISGNENTTITAPAGVAITNVTIKALDLVANSSKHYSQTVTNYKYVYTTAPTNTNTATDARGNKFTTATWDNVAAGASVNMRSSYTATNTVTIPAFDPQDAYPISVALPAGVAEYVAATAKCQSGNAAIAAQAQTLAGGCTTVYEVAAKVGKWVWENITYDNTVAQDAASVLASKRGNCEGFSNLAIALLRAKGIPARFCGGLLLSKAQSIPVTGGTVTVSGGGPGWHAVYEVYYPVLAAWTMADPQSSVHFSTNHTLVFGKGRDTDDTPVRSMSYLSDGTKANIVTAITTTVATVSGGYTCDGVINVVSTIKTGGEILFGMHIPPGGMEDAIYITAGPRVIGVYDSVTYTGIFDDANFSGDYADYWDWNISLLHNGGLYTIASDNHVYGHSQHTWRKCLAGLPAGFSWKKNAAGNIIGNVTLRTIDNDNYPHTATIPIEVVTYTGPFTANGTTVNRPNSFPVQGSNGSDMVYHLQLSQSSVFDFTLCDVTTKYDSKLEIFKADRSTTNYYNDDDPLCSLNYGWNSGLHNVPLAAGDYYVVVDGYGGQTGNFVLNASYSPAGSQVIAGLPFTHRGSTVGQTNKWNVKNTDGADVDYSITFTQPAACINLTTCASYTNFNTMFEVFKADRTTTNLYNNDATCSSGATKSTLKNARLSAGQYFVVVDGSNAATGNYELAINYANDFTVGALPYTHSSTNLGKKNDWDVMYGDGEDVSYLLTVSNNTPLDISLCGSTTNFDCKLEIFKEDGTTTGIFNDDDYTCTTNGLYAIIKHVVLSPGKYFIVVDGFNGATGNYTLRVSASTGMSKVAALSKASAVSAIKSSYVKELAKNNLGTDESVPSNMDISYLVYELQKRMNGGKVVVADFDGDANNEAIADANALAAQKGDFALLTSGLTRGKIQYFLPVNANVEVAIYSLNGSKVAMLAKGMHNAGVQTISLGAMKDKVADGHYICKMTVGNKKLMNKIILAK